MPTRAVILDFDGVVYNSSGWKRNGKRVVQIVKRCGYKIPRNILKKFERNSGYDGIKMIRNSFDLDTEAAEKIYREWERVDEIKFLPLIRGSKQVLEKLGLCQEKVILLTSRNRKNLMKVLDHFKITKLFDFVQARDDWSFVKPDPHVFCFVLHQLYKLGIHPHECVYVGDTILDFECTTSRALTSISVTTGVFSKADFLKAGQKKENILRSIADLPEWIAKHNHRNTEGLGI